MVCIDQKDLQGNILSYIYACHSLTNSRGLIRVSKISKNESWNEVMILGNRSFFGLDPGVRFHYCKDSDWIHLLVASAVLGKIARLVAILNFVMIGFCSLM